MKKIIKGLFVMVLTICMIMPVQNVKALASNDYTQWKQTDPEWNQIEAWPASAYPSATRRWMRQAGCLVTSISMLLRHYNVVRDSNVNSFNPWICDEALKRAGALNSAADLIWGNVQKAYSGFVYAGSLGYSLGNLQNLYNQGYACVVYESQGHYVAIKSVSGSTVNVMDPGGNYTSLRNPATIYYFRTTAAPAPTNTFNPNGCVDEVSGGAGRIYVRGWIYDRNHTSDKVQLHVYIGGVHSGTLTANQSRPDVQKVHSEAGVYVGFSGYVNTNKTGNQRVTIFAIDRYKGSNPPIWDGTKNITPGDTTPPTFEDVRITNVSNTGYTVHCIVKDNKSLSYVTFPTWTVKNDQDDITWERSNVSGTSYELNYRVNTSAHNNETNCTYITHIYAYDSYGNVSSVSAGNVYVGIKLATPVIKVSNTSSGVKLSWSKITGATKYKVYRKKGSGSYETLKYTTGTSYTDTKASNGTTYTYTVRAMNDGTRSSYKGKKVVRLSTNSITSISNVSKCKLKLKWSKNSKASGYQIQYSTSSSFKSGNKSLSVSGASTLSKTISSLKKGKTYYVRVRSYKTVSGVKYYSGWSAKKSKKISK